LTIPLPGSPPRIFPGRRSSSCGGSSTGCPRGRKRTGTGKTAGDVETSGTAGPTGPRTQQTKLGAWRRASSGTGSSRWRRCERQARRIPRRRQPVANARAQLSGKAVYRGRKGVERPMAAEPLLLTAPDLARLLQVAVSSVYRMLASGRLVRPVRLGGCVRWRAEEVRAWIEAGCPSASRWKWRPKDLVQ